MKIQQIWSKILPSITEPWNVGHSDLNVSSWQLPSEADHSYQDRCWRVFKKSCKITGTWNICHSSLQVLWGHCLYELYHQTKNSENQSNNVRHIKQKSVDHEKHGNMKYMSMKYCEVIWYVYLINKKNLITVNEVVIIGNDS